MKKVKAVSTRTTSNDGLEGQSDPEQPKVRRRVRTSAAMIGLAISVGTSNLLVTRQSDRTPAAEPVGNEPLVNTIPVDPEVSLGKNEELIVTPAVVKSLPLEAVTILSSSFLPHPQIQLQTATPGLYSLPRTHQEPVVSAQGEMGQQQSSQPMPTVEQVDLATSVRASTAVTSNKSPKLPEFGTAAKHSTNQVKTSAATTSRTQRTNQLLQKLKIRDAETASPSAKVNRQPVSLPTITAAPNLSPTKSAKQRPAVNLTASPSQQALIARLKQQSLKSKLNAWQQQTNSSTASAMAAKGQVSQPAVEPATQTEHLERSPFVIPDLSETATTNKPNVVAAKVAQNYQVKPGDTLTAIANRHGVEVSQLAAINNLPNPNQLQIQQQLKVLVPANPRMAMAPISVEQQAIATNLQASSLGSKLQTSNQAKPESFSGVGGNISEDETVVPLNPATDSAVKSQLQPNPYIQGLRTDIEKLRQKYSAQRATGQALTSTNTSSVTANAADLIKPAQTQPPASQPLNPEFLMARVPKRSEPAAKQPQSLQASSTAPPQPKSSVATAPLGLDAVESLDSLRGQQVSPELPPLGAADNYLPKQNVSLKGYIWPSRGALTSGYGWRWGRMHKGIDIAAPVGTPVFAAASGVVIKAGWNRGGYGKLVDIQHADGSLTRYAHNNKILVQAGQQVEQGQQISEMGNTGFSTGPHLHFEVHPLGKKAVDPIAYLPGK